MHGLVLEMNTDQETLDRGNREEPAFTCESSTSNELVKRTDLETLRTIYRPSYHTMRLAECL